MPPRSSCGACGGHRGAPNARTAAAVLNGAEVRAYLADRGMEVAPTPGSWPGSTTPPRDRVVLLDPHLVPAGHRTDAAALCPRLAAAGAARPSSAAALPGSRRRHTPARGPCARSAQGAAYWAQVFPEWGLAGNAAFIVAPRSLTQGLDLKRRVFLHSYEPAADPDGTGSRRS